MYDFYQIKLTEALRKRAKKSLKNLYQDIPETTGCIENNSKVDGCGSWCCSVQTPQVMYSEFLSTWDYVSNNWPKEKVIDLICRAVQTYLGGRTTNGCVFWNKESKLCGQHQTRPFNCRCYGQVPKEEFQPRYERLKILHQGDPTADFRPQCNLVHSAPSPTTEKMNEWFKELSIIEEDMGIQHQLVGDQPGGSYRTYHDHIILSLSSANFLTRITRLRLKGNCDEKEKFVIELKERLNVEKNLAKVNLSTTQR